MLMNTESRIIQKTIRWEAILKVCFVLMGKFSLYNQALVLNLTSISWQNYTVEKLQLGVQ